VFTSRILATGQSQCNFKSHMKSSCHSLIPFLPLFCSCQFRRLDSIQYLGSEVHILAGWCLETRLCSVLFYSAEHFFIATLHEPRRKHSLYCWGVFTDPLSSNEVLLLRALAPASMCLSSRCVVMDLYVTILNADDYVSLWCSPSGRVTCVWTTSDNLICIRNTVL
jgi:hypothetical protein